MCSPDVCSMNTEDNCTRRIKILYTHNHTMFKILICCSVVLLLFRGKNRLWMQCDKYEMNLEWVLCMNGNGFLSEKQWMHQYSLQCYCSCARCTFSTFWKFATDATAHRKKTDLFLQIIQQCDNKEASKRTCFFQSGRQLSQFTTKLHKLSQYTITNKLLGQAINIETLKTNLSEIKSSIRPNRKV